MTRAGRNTYRYKQLQAQHRADSQAAQRPCWLCRQPIDYDADREDPNSYSLDHIKPLSTHPELAEVYSNFAAAHLGCNRSRGAHAPRPDIGTPSRDW